MKNVLKFAVIASFCLLIFSCKKEDTPPSSPELAEEEWNALPELPVLKPGEVSKYTNFVEVGDRITYNNLNVISNATPIYGERDMLVVEAQKCLLFLYKTDMGMSAMKYNYSITGVRVNGDIIYIKGSRENGSVVFIKYVFSTSHEYLYAY